VVASEYFEYLRAIGILSSTYEDCPFECPNAEKKYDRNRNKNCNQCPKRQQQAIFEKQSREIVQIKLGDVKFEFEKVLRTLHRIATLEGYSPDKVTLFNSVLLGVFVDERAKSRERT